METFFADAIQYVRPNGEIRPQHIALSVDVKDQYDLMESCDCNLAAEVLTTGEVSVTIEHKLFDYDLDVVSNGPGIKTAFETMLKNFCLVKFGKKVFLNTEYGE